MYFNLAPIGQYLVHKWNCPIVTMLYRKPCPHSDYRDPSRSVYLFLRCANGRHTAIQQLAATDYPASQWIDLLCYLTDQYQWTDPQVQAFPAAYARSQLIAAISAQQKDNKEASNDPAG